VFQFLAITVEVQGNPAIEPGVANVGIERDIANPPRGIVSQEVVAVSGERLLSIGHRICFHEGQMNVLIAIAQTRESKIHTVAQEHGLESIPVENVPILGRRLTSIRLEYDGKRHRLFLFPLSSGGDGQGKNENGEQGKYMKPAHSNSFHSQGGFG